MYSLAYNNTFTGLAHRLQDCFHIKRNQAPDVNDLGLNSLVKLFMAFKESLRAYQVTIVISVPDVSRHYAERNEIIILGNNSLIAVKSCDSTNITGLLSRIAVFNMPLAS